MLNIKSITFLGTRFLNSYYSFKMLYLVLATSKFLDQSDHFEAGL